VSEPRDPAADAGWRRFSAELERLLELPPTDRDAALEQLSAAEAPLAERLARALAAADEEEGLLARPAIESWSGLVRSRDAETSEPAEIGPGSRLGAWRLGEELGRGGMGTVYAAARDDGQFEQHAALKLLRIGFDDAMLRARFVRERQILARLEHPGIARLLDGGVAPDGRPYLVLERVDGEPITAACDRQRFDVECRLRLFLEVAAAVDAAHRSLVVHRDLKPSNVLLAADGTVRLLDFGIAKLLDAEADDALTRTRHDAPLTPQYAAPEQARGEPATTATDVYALGLLLCEILAGAPPYRLAGDSARALERALEQAVPAAPSELARHSAPELAAARATTPERLARRLRGDLDAIVLHALARDPGERYASVADFARDVEAHLAGRSIAARRDSSLRRAARFARRHPVGVTATALVALLAVASVVSLVAALRSSAARLAEAERAAAIQGFLLDLFRGADPARARGEALTVRELLDAGAARVDRELAAQPKSRQAIVATLGALYLDLGAWDRAAPLLAQALELATNEYGPRSAEAAAALAALGRLDYWRDDYEQALERQDAALDILRSAPGDQRAALAALLHDSGSTLRLLERHDEAEKRQRQALEIDRGLSGDSSLAVAKDLAALTLTLHRAERDEEALPLAEQSVAIRRRELPADHPELADALEGLGLTLVGLGRGADAEPPLREMLAIRRQVYGDAHPQLLEALNSLASGLEAEAKFDESLALRREAVAVAKRVLSPGSRSLATQINNLAIVCYRLDDLACAADGFREALEIWLPLDGEHHPSVGTARNNLGTAWLKLGRAAEAKRELATALEIRRASAGDESVPVAQTLRNLGLAELALGELGAADDHLERSLELSRRLYAPRHPRLAEVLLAHGELRLAERRAAEAIPEIEEALGIRREHFGDESPLVREAEAELSRARRAAPRPRG